MYDLRASFELTFYNIGGPEAWEPGVECVITGLLARILHVFVFVCLWFYVPLENFSYRDVTIAGEGLQSLTCARHSWPLSSEGSLACQT